jgi:hypothetical protein
METWKHGDMETWNMEHGDIELENGKLKTRRFSLICLLLARKSVVSPFVDEEQTEVIHLQTD